MTADKVLLVDDEVEFVETLAERLRSRGLEVEAVTSGMEALRKLGQSTFDAVVLDFAMPGMDGLETLKKVLAQEPKTQVMLLTGQATIKTAVEATKLGAIDILEKPTDVDTLLEKIREARAKRLHMVEVQSRADIDRLMKSKGW